MAKDTWQHESLSNAPINGCNSTLSLFPLLLHIFPLRLYARMTYHLHISLFLEWGQAWSSLLRETLNFTFGLFFNSIPESPKARHLNWKTKIWCTCTFRGRPIMANETLINQIALKGLGAERVPGQSPPPDTQHLCVVPSSAITPLAQSFLSQYFYCICCPRQTAIKPR